MGSLSELFSEGKSGSFFYFSNDGRYLIKTIPHRELKSLVRLLPAYVRHVETRRHTLLPRFMGAYRILFPGKKNVHFVVMTNVFSTPRVIHERFDLKGSTHGRTAGAKNLEQYPDLVRKDLDLHVPFALRPDARSTILEEISSDLAFLRKVYTMDYSLLVGVHYPSREAGGADGLGAGHGKLGGGRRKRRRQQGGGGGAAAAAISPQQIELASASGEARATAVAPHERRRRLRGAHRLCSILGYDRIGIGRRRRVARRRAAAGARAAAPASGGGASGGSGCRRLRRRHRRR